MTLFNVGNLQQLKFLKVVVIVISENVLFVLFTIHFDVDLKIEFFHLPSRLIYLPKALLREHVLSPNGLNDNDG